MLQTKATSGNLQLLHALLSPFSNHRDRTMINLTWPARATCLRIHTNQRKDHPHAAYTLRGPHHSSHGLSACSVHATGSTTGKSRITRVRRTRNGVHISQGKDYPRAAFTLRGSHKLSQELPTCQRATRSTQVEARTTHVERELRGLHKSIHGLLQEAKHTLAH